jgi:signal transduction histidine kinase/CheY-like chemotaxis protein
MEEVQVSEITILKQKVIELEQELELEKKTSRDLRKRLETSKERDEHDLLIKEEIERQTCALRSSLEKAETDKRKKSEFLVNLSHEILTPMDGILGMTGLVLETDLTEEQRRYLEMVNKSADRLLGLVNDILDYSQIEAGKLRLLPVDFDLIEFLECDLYILKLAAQHKNIDLIHYIEPDIPQNVCSDPERLRQVLVNLVNNAIRFTEKGLVTVDVTTTGYDQKKNLILKFSITDTGIGIPYEKQKGIFSSLGAVGGGCSNKYSGAGLGLAVSARLVELAGGEIGLESDPGEGATFWFTWPVKEPAVSQVDFSGKMVDEINDASFVLKGAKILLAEDESISGALTEKILQQAGACVTMVEDGKQAVEEVAKGEFQVVLMDVQMPIMDGLTATREIRAREHKQGGHQSIIALTAHAMQGDREKCLQAGMDDYLAKPINKGQLIDMLTKYLTRTALVVDGDQVSQQKVVQALIESGWRVTIVETGRSAIYEASLSNFDLIVINMVPPQMDGNVTVEKIRKLEDFSGRRATIFGIGAPPDDHGIVDSGIDDYISVPVSKEKFKEKLIPLQDK